MAKTRRVFRQIEKCEHAHSKICRCHCEGARHGVKRFVKGNREAYAQLPKDDPHYVPVRKKAGVGYRTLRKQLKEKK